MRIRAPQGSDPRALLRRGPSGAVDSGRDSGRDGYTERDDCRHRHLRHASATRFVRGLALWLRASGKLD